MWSIPVYYDEKKMFNVYDMKTLWMFTYWYANRSSDRDRSDVSFILECYLYRNYHNNALRLMQ